MAVMPHTDVDRALKVALSLDIPFWPQLPHYSYHEDMYVQASEHFPGILLDMEKKAFETIKGLSKRLRETYGLERSSTYVLQIFCEIRR